jgi:hypothetical protein
MGIVPRAVTGREGIVAINKATGTCRSPSLLLPEFADDAEHGFGVRGFFEGLAKFHFVQELGYVGQGMEMFLKLSLRYQEEHDELDGLIVQRVEVDAFIGTTEGADDFRNQIRGGVGDTDAEPNARAHGRLALFDGGGDGIAVSGINFAGGHEIINQLVNGLPAVGGAQFRNDLRFCQNVSQVHIVRFKI